MESIVRVRVRVRVLVREFLVYSNTAVQLYFLR
eukprot:COSAG01_NODE_17577_length_1139_cov_4.703846_3_plen_32_part_01